MTFPIEHDRDSQRFVVRVDGHSGVLDYRLSGDVMTITHTSVPEAIGGRGIAAELMRYALETARAERWKVIPACSYAAAFMRKYPEFDDLIAG
ncbi:MAG: GNAT family N-acetyltransferase [Dokdonella sp.]